MILDGLSEFPFQIDPQFPGKIGPDIQVKSARISRPNRPVLPGKNGPNFLARLAGIFQATLAQILQARLARIPRPDWLGFLGRIGPDF